MRFKEKYIKDSGEEVYNFNIGKRELRAILSLCVKMRLQLPNNPDIQSFKHTITGIARVIAKQLENKS